MAKAKPRKIMTAALGVATVSYVVGCGRSVPNDDGRGRGDQLKADASVTNIDPTGNDSATNATQTSRVAPSTSNLMPPPTQTSPTGTSVAVSTIVGDTGGTYISGNLLPPPSTYPTSLPPDWTSDGPASTQTSGTYDGTTTGYGTTTNAIETVTWSTEATTWIDVAVDAGAADAQAGSDSNFDAGIIISGNLLPPPVPDSGTQTEE